jgi:hypothetical protein
MTNSPGLVSESCHESTFKLIRHHNFNDVFFSVGATWTFNKYNNIEKQKTDPTFYTPFLFIKYSKTTHSKHHIHVIIQNVKKRGIFSIEKNYGV